MTAIGQDVGGNGRAGLEHPQLGLPVAVYDYQDVGERTRFVVCRFEPKDFRPAHPTENGRWAWNLNGAPKLLYRLPDVEEALRDGRPIWIVDGEKDADALREAGFAEKLCATCCARAQGWSLELAEQLIGARRVRIVADWDGGRGLEQAREVRELLVATTGLGSHEVEIVRAAEGKDAYDHLAAGRTLDEFVLVDEAEIANSLLTEADWEPILATDFLDLPEPEGVELLGPLVLRGGRTILGGDSGHGKTTLAFAMTSAILAGSELLGYTGAGVGPALVIDLEQGVRSIKRGIRDAGLAGSQTYLLSLPDGLALDQNPDELARLERAVARIKPVVIVLDPYYKAHRGDANEERAVTDLMRNLDRLRTDYSFALLMPAHVRKEQITSGVRKLVLADIAGSGAISRGAEIVIGIERLSHGRARLRYLKDREGDLPVGEHIEISYSPSEGFEVIESPVSKTIEEMILTADLEKVYAEEPSGWLTVKQWQRLIGVREAKVGRVLDRLAAAGDIRHEIGPPGRRHNAKCYSVSASPDLWAKQGEAGKQKDGAALLSASPAFSIGEAEAGAAAAASSSTTPGAAEPSWADIEAAAHELQRRTGKYGHPLTDVIAVAKGEEPWREPTQTSALSTTDSSGSESPHSEVRTNLENSDQRQLSGTESDVRPAIENSIEEVQPSSTETQSSASPADESTSSETPNRDDDLPDFGVRR